MLTWQLLGAAVGAGLASGREVASFFGRYGLCGYSGIGMAVVMVALLAGAQLPSAWQGRWPARLWHGLNGTLLVVTGGAMLAGAGELATQCLPGTAARLAGMAVTMGVARWLARGESRGLAWVSRCLMVGTGVLLLGAMLMSATGVVTATPVVIPECLLRGAAYGGFNAALMQPLMVGQPKNARGRALTGAALLLGALLALGQAVLLRHPAAMAAPMPFLHIAGSLRQAEKPLTVFCQLCQLCLYLAILSTLTACLKGLQGRGRLAVAGICAVAAMGFTGVVEAAYPVLGGACMVMLAAMRLAQVRRGRIC